MKKEKLATLREIAEEVAKDGATVLNGHDDYECAFCESTSSLSGDLEHEPTCIVLKARAFIAGKKEGKNETQQTAE